MKKYYNKTTPIYIMQNHSFELGGTNQQEKKGRSNTQNV